VGGFFKSTLTGKDGESFDIGRVLWALAMLSLCAFQGHAVILHQTFEPTAFCGGAAMLLAAGGFGIAVKSHTEPDPK
jgi:hypothetical protein